VSPYKLTWLLKIHMNRLEWLGKLYMAAIHGGMVVVRSVVILIV